MKIKNLAIFLFTLLIILCGCTSKESNNGREQELTVYDLELNFYNENTVNDLENVTIYFPVVTNKEITSTALGGVGAKLYLKDNEKDDILSKLTLKSQEQDQINIQYNGYYISFLKYRLEYTGDFEINCYSSIELDDTKLWVSCNEEIKSADYVDTYLKISIAQDDVQHSPNLEQQISKMIVEIQSKLKEKC